MFVLLIFVFTVSSLTHAENMAMSASDQKDNYCLLPPYPGHGRYTVSNHPSAKPGEIYSYVKLDIYCDTGYLYNNTIKKIFCIDGEWSAPMPTCVPDLLSSCTVPTGDLRVEYRCLWFPGTLGWSWECESIVPSGTIVRPICRSPAYFSLRELSEMHCKNGTWDYNPICKPACGLTTQHLQLEGTSTNHLEHPWNAVIYEKLHVPYHVHCIGSLITANKLISAAYCFHDSETTLRPTSNFQVAVNKMYYEYKDPRDKNSQYSDVDEIIIPSSYRGETKYYEDNIAIVVVKRSFFFHLSVQPVCLDFDSELDRTQLAEGNSGQTVSWNVQGNDGESFEVLNVVNFSYMKNEDCSTILPSFSQPYLTKDKFCARNNNGTWRDGIDSGSGLAFLESTTQRYYLRGVSSDYLRGIDDSYICSFTPILKHEHFIKPHL